MNKLLAAVVFLTVAGSRPEGSLAQQTNATAAPQDIEQIFVARSVRETAIPPTEFCGKANSGVNQANSEGQFAFRSVVTRDSDGRVIDAESTSVGNIHACFGPSANSANLEFYGDGTINEVTFKGFGDCIISKSDFPEKGVNVLRCYLDLRGLPEQYVGGQLTTNSITSKNRLGTQSDPSGYTQISIATIRLWKKRGGS